jgi:hypothetical protein
LLSVENLAETHVNNFTQPLLAHTQHEQGWPEFYIYTVYDCIFGDFPAKNTEYTPYIYGSDQPET